LGHTLYIWKHHKETPYVAILNKQKCHFKKIYQIEEQEGRTGPAGGDEFKYDIFDI
jgi:hypothetical protein